MELFRCPTCFGLLVDPGADRCPTCHQRLEKRPPIVLTGAGRTELAADGSPLLTKTGRRRRGRRFGSKGATAE